MHPVERSGLYRECSARGAVEEKEGQGGGAAGRRRRGGEVLWWRAAPPLEVATLHEHVGAQI